MSDKDWVIAGFWRRSIGGLIDVVCLLAFVYYGVILTGIDKLMTDQMNSNAIQEYGRPILMLVFAGFILLGVCEYFFAKTPGKAITGTRVVNADFGPISIGQALTRNILRVIDAFGAGLLGIVFMLCNQDRQRLGDMVARTYVVKRRR